MKPTRNWKQEIVSSKHTLLGEPLAFWEAPEPTNIIWEHRDRTFKEQTIRKLIVIFTVFLTLLGAFIVFYILKQQTINNYKKYPPTTDCQAILDMFDSNFADPLF